MISHNMEDVRAVADRIVVLRLGRNNGIFTPDASNEELVGAITGAVDNAVSRRAHRVAEAQGRSGMSQRPTLDRSDVRVAHATGIGGQVSAFIDRVRSGDLGSLPVIVGLVIIWTIFTAINPIFLSSNNLVNMLFDCSTTGVIALGIVCVLMLGEIDLSVGSMSGVASALIGVLWVNGAFPLPAAVLVTLVPSAGRSARSTRCSDRGSGCRASSRRSRGCSRSSGSSSGCSATPGRSTCPTARGS